MKKIYPIILFSLIVLISGCKTKPEDIKPPKYILDKEKMIDVLTDIHVAESFGYLKYYKEEERNKLMEEQYALIMKIHGIEPSLFDTSFSWYMVHPAVLEPMYDKVMEKIALLETQTKDLTGPERDSIDVDSNKNSNKKTLGIKKKLKEIKD